MEPYRFRIDLRFPIAGDNVPERFWFERSLQTEKKKKKKQKSHELRLQQGPGDLDVLPVTIDRHESQRRAQTTEARRVHIQPENLVLDVADDHGPVAQLVAGVYHLRVPGPENSARVIQRLFDLHQSVHCILNPTMATCSAKEIRNRRKNHESSEQST